MLYSCTHMATVGVKGLTDLMAIRKAVPSTVNSGGFTANERHRDKFSYRSVRNL